MNNIHIFEILFPYSSKIRIRELLRKIKERYNDYRDFYNIIKPIIVKDKNFPEWREYSKTYNGQIKILKEAQKGNISAITFLIFDLLDKIASVFFSNFLPFQKNVNFKDAQQDFINITYGLLLSKENVNPLKTFNYYKFDKKTDLIEKFGYYLIGYLKNEVKKLITEERKRGITGNIRSKDMKNIEYSKSLNSSSVFDDESEEKSFDIASYDEDSYEEILDAFLNMIEEPEISYKRKDASFSLKDLLRIIFEKNALTLTDLTKITKLSATRIFNLLKKLGEYLKEYGILEKDFITLLKRRNSVLKYLK